MKTPIPKEMSEKMTIGDMAGFCPEEAIWKMMADVSACLLEENVACVITPDTIVVDRDAFFVETGHEAVPEYLAPELFDGGTAEAKQLVWSLGAIAYYAATGHVIFGGHGGGYQYQHPTVSLPVLPKGLNTLASVLQKCLCCNPDERIDVKELQEMAVNGWLQCRSRQRQKCESTVTEQIGIVKPTGDRWPEKMIEI